MKETDTRRVVIAGGTGTLGSACARQLAESGYEVVVLSRSQGGSEYPVVTWDPARGEISDPSVIEGAEAVVNLCGTPLDGKRWTASYKQVLRNSRIKPAKFLDKLIRNAKEPPRVYVGGAAIGIYGDSGPKPVDEDFTTEESKFVVELAKDWEEAHFQGNDQTRSVMLRTSIVFDSGSGFIKQLTLPARFGVYPYFGDGLQMQSWIHISDFARVVHWSIEQELSGIYNVASPSPATLFSVMSAFREARKSPGILISIPGIVARPALGEMSELLFAGCNADSSRLQHSGFEFEFPTLKKALADIVG